MAKITTTHPGWVVDLYFREAAAAGLCLSEWIDRKILESLGRLSELEPRRDGRRPSLTQEQVDSTRHLTTAEAAAKFGVHERTVYRLRRKKA